MKYSLTYFGILFILSLMTFFILTGITGGTNEPAQVILLSFIAIHVIFKETIQNYLDDNE